MNEFYFQQKHDLQVGDRLVRHKGGVTTKHHGVYAGEDQYGQPLVAENQIWQGARLISLSEFLKHDESNLVRIDRFEGDWYDRQDVIKRINKTLGESYNLLFNNCEHFANYVIDGKRKSPQILKGFGLAILFILFILFLPKMVAAARR